MKKAYLFLIAVFLILITSFAYGAETVDDIQLLASRFVPEGAVLIAREIDDGKHELKFWVSHTQEVYEVDLAGDGVTVLKVKREAKNDRGGKKVSLDEEAIRAKALEYYPDAIIHSVRLAKDDGYHEYRVSFSLNDCNGELVLHSETGTVLESEICYTDSPVKQNEKADRNEQSGGLIGVDRARAIALSKADGGSVVSIRLEWDDGRQVYDGKVVKDSWEYEFEIDAQNGAVREWDRDRIEEYDRDDWDDDWDD